MGSYLKKSTFDCMLEDMFGVWIILEAGSSSLVLPLRFEVLSRRQQLALKKSEANLPKKGRGRGRGKGSGKGRGKQAKKDKDKEKEDEVEEKEPEGKDDDAAEGEVEVPEPPKKTRKKYPKSPAVELPSAASKKDDKKTSQKQVPEAKAKSGTKRKGAVKEKDSEKKAKGDEQEAPPEKAPPKTFARRRRTESNGLKWDAVKQVFNEMIRPCLAAASVHEERVGFNVYTLAFWASWPQEKTFCPKCQCNLF